MKREEVEKAAKEEVENIVFSNICSEEIDSEESNYEAGRRDALYDFGQELFIAGAKWQLNSVWYDESKIPNKPKLVIVEFPDGRIDIVYFHSVKSWKSMIKRNGGIRWAYIDDLKPNVEG